MHLIPFSAHSAFMESCWCDSFSLFFLPWNCCVLWSLAPDLPLPPSRHSQGHVYWVKHLAFGFLCQHRTRCLLTAPWLAFLPERGQRRQPLPVTTWASTHLWDCGPQEAAEGGLAAGTGAARVSEEHLDQTKTAGEGVSHTKITEQLQPSKG